MNFFEFQIVGLRGRGSPERRQPRINLAKEVGKVVGDFGAGAVGPKQKGIEVDEEAFTREGQTADEARALAAAAQGQVAPQITAADIQQAQIGQVAPAGAATVGTVDPITGAVTQGTGIGATQAEFLAAQGRFVGGLEETVAGQGPSVAELQLREGQQADVANALALAASQPGNVNPAIAARLAEQARAEGSLETNQAAALLRAQEIAQARGQLGTALGQDVTVGATAATLNQAVNLQNAQLEQQTRIQNQNIAADIVAQQAGLDHETVLANLQAEVQLAIQQGNIDLAINLRQAELQQEASALNLESELTQTQLNNDLVVFYQSLGFQIEESQFRANQDLQELLVNQDLGISGLNTQQQIAASQVGTQLLGAAASGAAGLIPSDVRLKTNIAAVGDPEIGAALLGAMDSDESIEMFLDKLEAYSFRYKDPTLPGTVPGELIGIMAQDAEKSRAGREMVVETEVGKGLDVVKALSLALASSANLNDRVKRLES